MATISAVLTVEYHVEVEVPDTMAEQNDWADILENSYSEDGFTFQTPEDHGFDSIRVEFDEAGES